MIPASLGGWSPKLVSYKCYRHINKEYLAMHPVNLYFPPIHHGNPSTQISTDRQDLFLPKKTKLKQSWHLVKDIRHSSWEVLRIRKLLPNVFSWCCFSANCSAENTASKHALSSTQIAVFNSPLVPTVDKFGITILVEYLIVLLFKDASVSL